MIEPFELSVGDTVTITQTYNRHFEDHGIIASVDIFDDYPYTVDFSNGTNFSSI